MVEFFIFKIPGGQPGHEHVTLEVCGAVDEIIGHLPTIVIVANVI
jgi:hypothetical protein